VLTSGATTDACLVALRKAGVRRVRIACFARVADDTLAIGGYGALGGYGAIDGDGENAPAALEQVGP